MKQATDVKLAEEVDVSMQEMDFDSCMRTDQGVREEEEEEEVEMQERHLWQIRV